MKEQTDFEEKNVIPDPWSLPLETLDVSKAEIFRATSTENIFED